MNMLSPKEIVAYAAKSAMEKGSYTFTKTMSMSFLAGVYIAMGGLLAILVGYGMPGLTAANPGLQKLLMGATFPIGLMMVVMAGGELFTGNCAYFMPNVLSGRQTWRTVFRNWSLVWIGNFIGALFFAYFLVYLTKTVHYEPWLESIHKLAAAKTSNTFIVTFLKGIGANWLVCLAMWLAMSAKDTIGKIFAIWWPVMCFVAIGYEHSIANMFFIPLSMMEGGETTMYQLFIDNLLPATLGNIVGGALFVGGAYWFIFDKLNKSNG